MSKEVVTSREWSICCHNLTRAPAWTATLRDCSIFGVHCSFNRLIFMPLQAMRGTICIAGALCFHLVCPAVPGLSRANCQHRLVRRASRAGCSRATLAIDHAATQLSVGPFSMTRPNPTHQLSDPTHRKSKNMDPTKPNRTRYN